MSLLEKIRADVAREKHEAEVWQIFNLNIVQRLYMAEVCTRYALAVGEAVKEEAISYMIDKMHRIVCKGETGTIEEMKAALSVQEVINKL